MAQQEKTFPPPVDWDELYPGRFLKAADFKGKKPTLTIASVRIEELIGDKGPQIKGIVTFERTEKHLALNKTNGICLKEMFGKKVQEWRGHRVTLFAAPYQDGDECIRIWGSPELDADRTVVVQLPRKRPFNMTLHRVVPASGNASGNAPARRNDPPPQQQRAQQQQPQQEPPPKGSGKTFDVDEQRERLALAPDIEEFDSIWASIQRDYDTAGVELPIDLGIYAKERRESLAQTEPTF